MTTPISPNSIEWLLAQNGRLDLSGTEDEVLFVVT